MVEETVGDWDSGELEILDRKKQPIQRDFYEEISFSSVYRLGAQLKRLS